MLYMPTVCLGGPGQGALGLWSTSEFENNAKNGKGKSKAKSKILSSNIKECQWQFLE